MRSSLNRPPSRSYPESRGDGSPLSPKWQKADLAVDSRHAKGPAGSPPALCLMSPQLRTTGALCRPGVQASRCRCRRRRRRAWRRCVTAPRSRGQSMGLSYVFRPPSWSRSECRAGSAAPAPKRQVGLPARQFGHGKGPAGSPPALERIAAITRLVHFGWRERAAAVAPAAAAELGDDVGLLLDFGRNPWVCHMSDLPPGQDRSLGLACGRIQLAERSYVSVGKSHPDHGILHGAATVSPDSAP
jgi:hypothetical protein